MLKIIWFIIWVTLISIGLVWLIDNKGSVDISWVGYKVTTDVVTACFLAIFLSLIIFSFAYFLAKILSFKFRFTNPFEKNPAKKKNKLIKRYQKALDLLVEASISLNSGDLENSIKLQKQINSLTKNPKLQKLLEAQISYLKGDFSKAGKLFSSFEGSKNAGILALKSQLENSLNKGNEKEAIAIAEDVLNLRSDDEKTAALLFDLYKKQGNFNGAKNVVKKNKTISNLIENERDVAIVNSALALDLYLEKNYRAAIKQTKIALEKLPNFLPALIILTKSYLKSGMGFLAALKIREVWKTTPSMALAKIYNFIYRKSSNRKKLDMALKLHHLNPSHYVSDLVVAQIALETKKYNEAREYLNLALSKKESALAYWLMADLERKQNNLDLAKKYSEKSLSLNQDQAWQCRICHHQAYNWYTKCSKCNSHDSFAWQE